MKKSATFDEARAPKCVDPAACMAEYKIKDFGNLLQLYGLSRQGVRLNLSGLHQRRLREIQKALEISIENALNISPYTRLTLHEVGKNVSFILSVDFDQKQKFPLRAIIPGPGKQLDLWPTIPTSAKKES